VLLVWVVTLESNNTCSGEQVLEMLSIDRVPVVVAASSINLELWRRLGNEPHLIEVTKRVDTVVLRNITPGSWREIFVVAGSCRYSLPGHE